jgi:hypothetical protein
MKMSELILNGEEHHIETPMDSYRVVKSIWDKTQFILDYGDVEIVRQEKGSLPIPYAVPAFAERRKGYSASKAIECAKWGCE